MLPWVLMRCLDCICSTDSNNEITQEIYDKLGSFDDDSDNEELIRTGETTYSFANTMYGTLGTERLVWNEEANETMEKAEKKNNLKK